jgi:endoglycosylceramidase
VAAVAAMVLAACSSAGSGSSRSAPNRSTASSTPSAAALSPITNTGHRFTDDTGRVVVLHGVNMVAKQPPYAPDALGFDADDAAFLAANGLTVVRLGVIYAAVEPQPGKIDTGYLDRIAKTVSVLADHGIYTLLDFHQDLYNEAFQGEGFPDWAVLDDGLPATPKKGFPANYYGMKALNAAFDNFWHDRPGPGGVGLQERFAATAAAVASRFAHQPGVLGYDIINEPWPGSPWASCLGPQGCADRDALLGAFQQKVITAIRRSDASHLVFYEPYLLFNFGTPTQLPKLTGGGLGMSFHDYCQKELLHAGETCAQQMQEPIDLALARSAATGDALLLSEFGSGTGLDSIATTVAQSDAAGLSWTEWAYCGCGDPTTRFPDTEALVHDPARPPAGANVDEPRLRLLATPHPLAIAGTPDAWHFDASTSTFRLSFSTQRVDGTGSFPAGSTTVVSVPAAVYPHGYRVAVTGGRVTSAVNAARLVIVSSGDATAISLTVTPATA